MDVPQLLCIACYNAEPFFHIRDAFLISSQLLAIAPCPIVVHICEEFGFICSVTLLSSHSIGSRRPQPLLVPSSGETVLLASAHVLLLLGYII